MKQVLKLFILLLLVTSSVLNGDFWSSPVEFSASTEIENINISVITVGNSYSNSTFVVWQQILNNSTSRIVFKELDDDSSPQVLLYEEGVKFENPKFLETSSNGEQPFYLFYESNENGEKEVLYLKYDSSGEFSNGQTLSNTEAGVDSYDLGPDIVVWEAAGTIYMQKLNNDGSWSELQIVDSQDCSNPVVDKLFYSQTRYIAWLKSDKVNIVGYQMNSNEFEESEVLAETGLNSNLKFNSTRNSCYSWGPGQSILSWENRTTIDSKTDIRICSRNYGEVWEIFGIDQFEDYNKSRPVVFFTNIPSKFDLFGSILAFVSDVTAIDQIYANNYLSQSDVFENISNNTYLNRNPQLFVKGEDEFRLYLFWESYIDNNWQLQYATNDFNISAIDENQNIKEVSCHLYQNYPNPFNPETTISYDVVKAGNIKITVYNHKGELVKKIVDEHQEAGKYSIKFNGNSLESGVYFYQMVTNEFTRTMKSVLVK